MPSWLEMLELNLGLFDKLKDCPTPRLISAFFLAKQNFQPVKKKHDPKPLTAKCAQTNWTETENASLS